MYNEFFISMGKEVLSQESFLKVLGLFEFEFQKTPMDLYVPQIKDTKFHLHPFSSLHDNTFHSKYQCSISDIGKTIRSDEFSSNFCNLTHLPTEII